MELESFFRLFFDFISDIINTLGSVSISAFGVSVPFSIVIGACIILGFVANVFWRGEKG